MLFPGHFQSFMGNESREAAPLESSRKSLSGYLINLGASSIWFHKVFLELLHFEWH